MRTGLVLALLLASLPALADETETPDVLPDGEAREEVFYLCTACHNTALIRRSGLSRESWDGLMTWMTDRHGMTKLEGEDRERVVGYLAEHFPPRRQQGGNFRQPF